MGGGEDDEGDVACGVQEGRLEEADHGDLAKEELHGHVEDQEAVAIRGAAAGDDDEGELVVED